ncbi:MAG: 16S rRNA processing protein RimM [Magnetovibrio sp.]|nr:16S rRNA processing protein RimM [Magnetovibrio sp.]|tara:strand:+ start:2140 stop:2685 length:546 start_codon:yes stop_codon:yes gene_type:complete
MITPPDPLNLVLLGKVGSPRGIKGDIWVKSYTVVPEHIASYGTLWNEDASKSFSLTVTGTPKGLLIARIKGVNDRNTAEALKGTELYLKREALPLTEKDVFYHLDLIGLKVQTTDGEFLGLVDAVFDFGAGDVLELIDGPFNDVFIPFTKDIVPIVDIENGQLIVDPPEGLLEPLEYPARA